MEIRFTQAPHWPWLGALRLGKGSATGMTTGQGNRGWLYVGPDERGRELEVIAVEITSGSDQAVLLVIHAMPTDLRGTGSDV